MKKIIIIIAILFCSLSADAATKLFESGFDTASTITVNAPSWPLFITSGTDATSGYNWSALSGYISQSRLAYLSGNFNTYACTWGEADCSEAEIVADPEDAGNKVLHYIHYDNAPGEYGRLSLSFLWNESVVTGFNEGYFKYKMRFSDLTPMEAVATPRSWFVLLEQFIHSEPGSEHQEFRWNFSLRKAWGVGQKLYWRIAGQDYTGGVQGDSVWSYENTDVPIPMEEWFLLEVYCKKGNASTGRVVIWITPEGGSRTELFNITNYTEDPADPTYYAEDWQIFKNYVEWDLPAFMTDAGEPLQAWYDDFEYWDTDPTVNKMQGVNSCAGCTLQ